jgi:spore coat protein U-like protein
MLAVMRALTIAGAMLCAEGIVEQTGTMGRKSCAIAGVTPITFGNYDPTTGNSIDTLALIAYKCGNSNVRSIDVRISLGPGGAGTFERRMTGGRDVLRYNIYLDAARNIIWGDGTGGTEVFERATAPNNQLTYVPVFGRVFSGQDVAADAYSDHLVVTLDF